MTPALDMTVGGAYSRTLMSPMVHVVVLNWKQAEVTLHCIRSLLALDYPHLKIIVVDNCSQDGSVERLRAEFGNQITLLVNPDNLGYTGGNNAGITYALEHGADYVLLLNNDTYCDDPSLVTKLVAAAQDEQAGLVSPSIYYYDAPTELWYAGAKLDLWRGWWHNDTLPSDSRPVDTGYASGCCLLASRPLIEAIGPLKCSYFLTMEDVEWSYRARSQGWRVLYAPAARLLHKESLSSRDTAGGVYSPTRVYYEYRNAIWFVRQYGNVIQRWLIWPLRFMGRWGYQCAGYMIRRRWTKLRALLRAIRDGLLDEFEDARCRG